MKRILLMCVVFLMATIGTCAQTWSTVSNSNELINAVSNGAYIRLTSDITLSNYLDISTGIHVTLDLNGHALQRSLSVANADGHVIEVFANATLTLCDGSGNGSGLITGGRANNGGGICNYGTLNFEGGTISACYAGTTGGGIKNNTGATLNMSGGAVSGCYSQDGGGIYNADGGTLNITGGSINGNTSGAAGGGIYLYGGTATLSGIIIYNNTSVDGGGIYVHESATADLTACTIVDNNSTEHGGGGIVNHGTVSLHGSTITGNTCLTDGAGLWTNGTLNIEGDITITGNKKSNDMNSNFFCTVGHAANVTGSLGTSTIGVAIKGSSGVVTSGLSGKGDLSNFINDFPELVQLELTTDGEAQLTTVSNSIHYVEYSWDAENRKTVGTIKKVTADQCYFLDGTDGEADFNRASTDKEYLVVRGTNTYKDIFIPLSTKLILCDGASLTMNRIRVNSELKIYSQINDSGKLTGNSINVFRNFGLGSLEIHGGNLDLEPRNASEVNFAAIGGFDNSDETWNPDYVNYEPGSISIYSGNVKAKGGLGGAGIGGKGDTSKTGGTGGIVNIFGGIVNATGGMDAAGIGGGPKGDGGTINIFGGTVIAQGGKSNDFAAGAGIGGGGKGSGGTITISGGHVEATGGYSDDYSSAGIGGGGNANGGTITISGGYVKAQGGEDAPGIGSGEEKSYNLDNVDGGNITITGGTVYAYGIDMGSAIGAAEGAAAGIIKILGGYVYAEGGENSGGAFCSHDTSDGNNNYEIGDPLMVSIGEEIVDVTVDILLGLEIDPRLYAMANNRTVIIQPCNHSGAAFTVVDANKHRLNCNHCLSEQADHSFGNYSTCAVCGLVKLSNDANNSSIIEHWNGQTKSIILNDRTLYKDETWNTLCLPFSLTAEQMANSPLAGATVKTLSSSTFNSKTGTMTLNFTEDLTAIEAGKPYIVKWAKADNIVSPLFRDVPMSSSCNDITNDDITFKGIYAPYSTGGEDKTMLYLAANNKLYYPNGDMTIGAFRAYFRLVEGVVGGIANTSDVKEFVLNFDGETTRIGQYSSLVNQPQTWYTIDGRRLTDKPTSKGLYICNGEKVIIK